jgi:hypothetical protein
MSIGFRLHCYISVLFVAFSASRRSHFRKSSLTPQDLFETPPKLADPYEALDRVDQLLTVVSDAVLKDYLDIFKIENVF